MKEENKKNRKTIFVVTVAIICLVVFFWQARRIEKISSELATCKVMAENCEKWSDDYEVPKGQDEQKSLENSVPVSVEEPTLKIEKCKTQAKIYADGIAKKDYLEAFQKAMDAGDTETAQVYLEFSYGPEHPADYDNNYSSEYIRCLDN